MYNQQGKINHQVFAQKMEHFDLLGFTLFKKPQYTLYTQTGEPWHINAMDGTLYDDQRLQFENDVQISSLKKISIRILVAIYILTILKYCKISRKFHEDMLKHFK